MSVQALPPHSPITPSGLALGGFQVTTPVVIDSDFSPSPREDPVPSIQVKRTPTSFSLGESICNKSCIPAKYMRCFGSLTVAKL